MLICWWPDIINLSKLTRIVWVHVMVCIGTLLKLSLRSKLIYKSHIDVSFLVHNLVFLFELVDKTSQFVNFWLNSYIAIIVLILLLLVVTLVTPSFLTTICVPFSLLGWITFLVHFNKFKLNRIPFYCLNTSLGDWAVSFWLRLRSWPRFWGPLRLLSLSRSWFSGLFSVLKLLDSLLYLILHFFNLSAHELILFLFSRFVLFWRWNVKFYCCRHCVKFSLIIAYKGGQMGEQFKSIRDFLLNEVFITIIGFYSF
jgi:hypothetical protein